MVFVVLVFTNAAEAHAAAEKTSKTVVAPALAPAGYQVDLVTGKRRMGSRGMQDILGAQTGPVFIDSGALAAGKRVIGEPGGVAAGLLVDVRAAR